MIFFIFIVMLIRAFSEDVQEVLTLKEMKKYFSTTYMRKVEGKEKAVLESGYHDSWNIHHLHHVCVKDGRDGLYMGVEKIDNEWKDKRDPLSVSEEDWNYGTGHKKGEGDSKQHSPLKAKRLLNEEEYRISRIYGKPTLFLNCHQQEANSTNPAHLMMKLGQLYELSYSFTITGVADKNQAFMEPLPAPFANIFFHQCANPELTGWKWGSEMMDLVMKELKKSGVIGQKTKFHTMGYTWTSYQATTLTCFDDMYLMPRVGTWMTGIPTQINFRKDVGKLLGQPASALSKPGESVAHFSLAKGERQGYCPKVRREKKQKSDARIKIFQRSGTKMLRKFINLKEVISLAQEYTTKKVEVLTLNSESSVRDQIKLFNNFDILITCHGSHLTNGKVVYLSI